jgi:hypothetical protein
MFRGVFPLSIPTAVVEAMMIFGAFCQSVASRLGEMGVSSKKVGQTVDPK